MNNFSLLFLSFVDDSKTLFLNFQQCFSIQCVNEITTLYFDRKCCLFCSKQIIGLLLGLRVYFNRPYFFDYWHSLILHPFKLRHALNMHNSTNISKSWLIIAASNPINNIHWILGFIEPFTNKLRLFVLYDRIRVSIPLTIKFDRTQLCLTPHYCDFYPCLIEWCKFCWCWLSWCDVEFVV